MRENKFRGKRIDTGEWVYGFLFELSYDGSSVLCIGTEPLSANDYSEIYKSWYEEVDPSTICQFTGLLDKNGVEVYENDPVIINYGRWHGEPKGLTRQGKVVYDSKSCSFKVLINESKVLASFGDISLIVIHDTPTLAQGGDER